MGLPSRELPATLLDYFALTFPDLAKLAPEDAVNLTADGFGPGFMMLEDVPTGYFHVVRKLIDRDIESYAQANGMPMELAAKNLWRSARDSHYAQYKSLALIYHLVLNLELCGNPIFRIAAPLVERLRETSIDVPAHELRLPHPSLMLVYDDDVSLDLFHHRKPFGKAPRSGTLSTVLVDIPAQDGKRLLATTMHTKGDRIYGTIHRSMRYDEGTLEGMLDTRWPGDAPRRPDDPGQAFNRLVLNTLLYIVSRDARVGPETRTPGRPAPLVKSARRHRVVGDGLVALHRSAGHAGPASNGLGSGRQLASRHMVRGHWKLQAHGGHSEARKLVWIEPYVRGPELTQLLNRPRLVR